MRALWIVLALTGGRVGSGAVTAATKSEPRADPKIVSADPFIGQQGATFTATVRGSGLRGTTGVWVADAPIQAAIEGVETEPRSDKGGRAGPADLVHLRVHTAAGVKPGRYPFRLVTAQGVSNALPLYITEFPVLAIPAGSHESPETAVPVSTVPAVFTGRLSRRGDTDYYAFHADAGETLTFEVVSGFPQIAATGSAATIPNFDPSLAIYEAAGSWFDPKRLKRIAYNDEPVWVFGQSTDAYLVHRFPHAGSYLARVEAFAGQGGPDYSYHFKILRGDAPKKAPAAGGGWEERAYTRRLSANRLNQLAARGGKGQNQPSIETYRAAAATAADAPLVQLPATLEGELTHAGETQRARFHVDGPRDIAIEVETPGAAPPFFNPTVRLLNIGGEEVATNVLAGKGACNGALTKSLQAKTIVPLREPGDYTMEIRDATADLSGPEFRYRIQVRPQVPHVGQVRIDTDHVNLAPDEAKTVRIVFDREEDYRGGLTVMAESLPAGVQASVGADFEPEKESREVVGKRERYTPRTERTVLVLTAAPDAAPTAGPQIARLVVRPLVDGKLGEPLLTKSIPVMVIPKP